MLLFFVHIKKWLLVAVFRCDFLPTHFQSLAPPDIYLLSRLRLEGVCALEWLPGVCALEWLPRLRQRVSLNQSSYQLNVENIKFKRKFRKELSKNLIFRMKKKIQKTLMEILQFLVKHDISRTNCKST